MKKIILLTVFCAVFACSKKSEELPTLSKGTSAYFSGIILGQTLNLQENTEYKNGSLVGRYQPTNKTIPMQAYVLFNMSNSKDTYLDIYTPCFASEKMDMELLKQLLAVGNKSFETKYAPILPYEGIFTGFTFNYFSNNKYYTSFGEQNGSSIEVIELKDILPEFDAVKGLQIKFRINAKLYDRKGIYVGNIENSIFSTKYYEKKR